MKLEILQPWSTFVMKTKLPPEILQKMLKITDEIITNTESIKIGESGGGQQFEDEFHINPEILERENILDFFMVITRQFVIQQTMQMQQDEINRKKILNDEWYTKMTGLWIVSMKDNEYQPIHDHVECSISAVMYLRIPEYLPSRNPNQNDDGAICFLNNVSRDRNWPQATFQKFNPAVGDFYIFPSSILHQVYPFRTPDGKGERRSVSFNAIHTSKSLQEAEKKKQEVI